MRLKSLRRTAVTLAFALFANLVAPQNAVKVAAEPAGPAPAQNAATVGPGERQPNPSTDKSVEVSPPFRKGDFVEDVAQRTAFRKVMKKGEETQVLLSLTPWHYEVAPGVWSDIDNTLVDDSGPWAHRNKGNQFTARFTERNQGNQFRFEQNGRAVTFDLPEQAMGSDAVHAKVNKEKIRYESAGSPIAIDYEVAAAGVAEDIWLLRHGAPDQFHFTFSVEGVTPELQTDGTLWFVKNDSITERAFYIPAPYVEDSNGVVGKAEFELKALGQDRWQLWVHVDRTWLDEPGRTWPVRIDPTLWVDSDGGQWKQVTDGTTSTPDKYVTVGFDPTRDIHLQWNFRDMGLQQGQLLARADLNMTMNVTMDDATGKVTCDTCGSRFTIYQESQEWFRSAATWTQPAWQGTSWTGGTPCTTAPCTSKQVGNDTSDISSRDRLANGQAVATWAYDVTDMVRRWLDGSVSNNGFLLTNLYPANSSKRYIEFYSPLYLSRGSYLELSFTSVAPPTFQKVGGDPSKEIDLLIPTRPSATVVSDAPLIQTQLYVDGVLAATNTTATPGTLPFTLDPSRFPYGTHRLTVRTFTGTGHMVESLPAELTFGEAGLTPPTNLEVLPLAGGGYHLSWAPASANRPDRTITYTVLTETETFPGVKVPKQVATGVAGTTFDHLSPKSGIYMVQATATNPVTGATTATSAMSPAVGVVNPVAPSGLTYRATADGRALLRWTPSPSSYSDTTLQYQIYRNGQLYATTAASEYSVVAPATSGTTYTYEVFAVRVSGHRSKGQSVSVGYLPVTGGPSAPAGLKAEAEPDRMIRLSWAGMEQDGVTYDVARYVADDPLAIRLDLLQPTWTDTSCCSYREAGSDLQEGQGYWYRVRTVANGVAGPWSEPVGAVATTQRRTGLDQRQAFVQASLGSHGATVNLSSGNLALTAVDSAISLPSMGQTVARAYNSLAPQTGTILGTGWRLNAEWTVDEGTDWAVLTEGDGTEHRFRWDGSSYLPEEWYYGRLQRTISGWLLTYPDFQTYSFAADGRLQSIADRNGVALSLTYADGLLRQMVSPRSGRTVQFTYDALAAPAKLTRITDSAGRVTAYQYDGQGRLASVTNNAGEVTTYRYDGSGRLTAVQDNAKRWTYVAYGANGGVSDILDPLGNGLTLRYPAARTIVTDAVGSQTNYALNEHGWLTALTDAMQNTTTFSYALAGATLTMFTTTNPRGLVTEYSYDAEGRVTKVVDRAVPGAETLDLVAPGISSRETLAIYNDHGDLQYQFVQVSDTLYH
ncbi:MAG TPA: DUF6531 domain-containing protein, partial [Symbiobacteriaceae bacterium]|nr:DUF6531 domain-containing protein [Symbiobacteriaceae bacterium]